MKTSFDPGLFETLEGLLLSEYVDRVEADGRSGVNATTVRSLAGKYNELSNMHAFYLAALCVEEGIVGAVDLCMALLARPNLPESLQLSALYMLGDVHGFNRVHLRAVESIKLGIASGLIQEQLEVLRKRCKE